MLDDCGDRQRRDRRGVLAQRLDLDLEAWVGGGEHAVAAALVAIQCSQLRGVTQRPWIRTMVSGVFSTVMEFY